MNLIRRITLASLLLAAVSITSTGNAAPLFAGSFVHQSDAHLDCGSVIDNAVGVDNRRHSYSFQGVEGQETSFRLEFDSEQSRLRGAIIWIYDTNGYLVSRAISWFQYSVEVDVTFSATGKYLVYVSPLDVWGMYGDVPYTLTVSCAGGLCAALTLSDMTPEAGAENVKVIVARSFPAGSDEEAASWWPNMNYSQDDVNVVERHVYNSICPDVPVVDCSDEVVCAGSMQGGATYNNLCEVKSWVFEGAEDENENFAWYIEGNVWSTELGECAAQ